MATATKEEIYKAGKSVDLITLSISLEEFTKLVTVKHDERSGWCKWRVAGDKRLNYWLHDCVQRPGEPPIQDERSAIATAYNRLTAIQARKGQLNHNSVYMDDSDEVYVVERRHLEYASVRLVQDRVDGLWRWGNGYSVGRGGASCGATFTGNIVSTRDEGILAGAEDIKAGVSTDWGYREGEAVYKIFVNKIENFIGDFKARIMQPSLFS